MSSNVHGVPMGIVESPLLFSEIVPDAASEKRSRPRGHRRKSQKGEQEKSGIRGTGGHRHDSPHILVGDAGGPFVAGAIRFERRYHTVFDCRSTLPHADGTLSNSLRERSI